MSAAILGWGIRDTYSCMLFGDPVGVLGRPDPIKSTLAICRWVNLATFAFFLDAWLRCHKIHCQTRTQSGKWGTGRRSGSNR
jgi:hypothetical protein